MNQVSILIAGAGQLGSRYLQGLAKVGPVLDIHLYDVDKASLDRARERWNEVATESTPHRVSLHQSLAGIPARLELAIVATTASARPVVVEAIAAQSHVSMWILEKVLAQSLQGLDSLLKATEFAKGVWVNTPRRMLPWHQQIKAHLPTQRPLALKVDGSEWGLACNSIHFLDMLCSWTGEQLEEVITDDLAPHWIDAKRPGNYEIMGTLLARFSGGSSAALHVTGGDLHYTFELTDGELTWHMDETAGTATRSDGLSVPGRLPFQSEVTAGLVETILATGSCELPTLKESVELHRVFLAGLLAHWRKSVDTSADSLPIT
jgi:predicted dehydrogenase